MDEIKGTRTKPVPKSIEEKLAALEEKAKKRREKERAEISKLKRELEDAKFKAILKNLHENGIDSENKVKAMIKVFDLVKSYKLHGVTELKKALDAAREVSPELFPSSENESE
jgi:hypothetical protein